MKQVNKQNIHQKQSMLCIICNTKKYHLKKSKFKVVFDSFLFLSFCYGSLGICVYFSENLSQIISFVAKKCKLMKNLKGFFYLECWWRCWQFAKTIFYFLRSDTYCNCYAEVSGKRCNLKDGEGLQVPCKIIITRLKKYVNILKHELQKINELW